MEDEELPVRVLEGVDQRWQTNPLPWVLPEFVPILTRNPRIDWVWV